MFLQKLILRLLADASGYHRTINSVLRDTSSAASRITRDLSGGIAAGMRGASSAVSAGTRDMTSMISRMGKDASGVFAAIARDLSRAATRRGPSGGGGGGGGMGFIGGVTRLAAAFGLLAVAERGLDFVWDTGKQAVQLAADYQQASVAFEVMTGSATRGQKLLGDVVQMALETPFRSDSLIKSAQQLKAYGVATDQIVPTLQALGDVAAGGSGGSIDERLGRIAYAFGQVRSAGRLFGTELRQFTEAGVPIIESLAVVMKKPETSIKQLVETGQVGFREVVMAFNQMTGAGGQFYGMMEKQSQTVQGRWNAFRENIQIGLRNIGLAFFKGFGVADLLKEFTDMTSGVASQTAKLEGFFSRIREVFDVARFAAQALAEVVGGRVASSFESLSGSAPDWSTMKSGFTAFVRIVLQGIASVVQALSNAMKVLTTTVMKPVAEALKAAGPTAKADDLSRQFPGSSPFGAAWEGKIGWGEALKFAWGRGTREMGDATVGKLEPESVTKAREAAGKIGSALDGMIGTLEKVPFDVTLVTDSLKKFDEFLLTASSDATAANRSLGGLVGGIGLVAQGFDNRKLRDSMLTEYRGEPKGLQMLAEWRKEIEEGATPLQQFTKQMKDLNSLALQSNDRLYDKSLMGAVGMPGLFGASANAAELAFGARKIAEPLLKDAMQASAHLPAAQYRGSSEAQDTINRTTLQQKSIVQLLEDGLNQQKAAEEDKKQRDKDLIDAVRELQKRGLIPGRI